MFSVIQSFEANIHGIVARINFIPFSSNTPQEFYAYYDWTSKKWITINESLKNITLTNHQLMSGGNRVTVLDYDVWPNKAFMKMLTRSKRQKLNEIELSSGGPSRIDIKLPLELRWKIFNLIHPEYISSCVSVCSTWHNSLIDGKESVVN